MRPFPDDSTNGAEAEVEWGTTFDPAALQTCPVASGASVRKATQATG